jgi:hypothetical protein
MSDPVISATAGETLLEALAWLTYAMDHAEEDLIDTDTAVAWMEIVAGLLHRLPAQERHDLAALSRALADKSTDAVIRSAHLEFIEGFGLDEDEG